MDWSARCAVVIPCLNENRTIRQLVESVARYVSTIYLVDDGSTDGSGEMARRAGAQVLRHECTRGKGAALRTGWDYAKKSGFDWALTMDGDGQHSAEDISSFFDCAERTSAALIVGNRMHGAAAMPPVRRFVNHWMSRRLSRLASRDLPDSQCGFRLLDLNALANMSINTDHFEIESEVLLGFVRHHYRVEFVPIRVIYKAEQSKIQPARDTFRWVGWWLKAKRTQRESARSGDAG